MAAMQPTPSSPLEDPKQALRFEQLRLLFETQPFSIGATLIIAVIVVATLLPATDPQRLLFWCGALVVSNIARVVIGVGWRRDTQRLQHAQNWWWRFFAATSLAGVGWGLCNFLLFPQQSPSQQLQLVFITCGISVAAGMSLAADRRIAWSFLIPCTLPLEWQLYQSTNGFGPSSSAMGVVYLMFMAGVINRLHHYIADNIVLRMAVNEREQLRNEFAQALHFSQEKLQALFELSPLGCALLRTDGSLVQSNQSFQHMLGCCGADLEKASMPFSSPTCRDENWRRWQQLIQHGGTDAVECELVRQDGGLVPVSVHRMVFDAGDGQHYVWALVEDITQRKQNEKQLQALNNRLSLATQAGGIGVWELDVARNELLWDVRMCEIYGIEPTSAPISFEMPAAFAHPDDWSRVGTEFMAVLNDPTRDRHGSAFRIVRHDDTERSIRQDGIIQRDELGRAQRFIGVAWDITEIKRVERMKSEFVATVSHELRTPLTSIRGSLGLVASGVVGDIPAAAQELIMIAYKNSERLSLLINDILDIEKIESGKMSLDLQIQALRPLLQQVVEANQGFAQSFSVHLVLHENDDEDLSVVVDASRFMQVMANLISNAVKFSSANGSVEIAHLDAQARVRIEVRDRGPGVCADFRERIFQRFSQADASDTRVRGGSGLGLAITKTLVERMHGEIGFTERAGGGTIFFVEWPRQ